ncbi:MAG TPA: RDD family protein [Rhodanobacteraceae bacterium]
MPVDNLPELPAQRQFPGLHAGFWRRVAAWVVDALILAVVHWGLLLLFAPWLLVPWALLGAGRFGLLPHLFEWGLQPFGIVVWWLYFALFESSSLQATPGKLVIGLQVTDAYGRRVGFGRASGRYFGMYVSTLILCIGYLLAGWTARRQALHDVMAGCCVVRKTGFDAWRAWSVADASAMSDAAPAVPPVRSTSMPGWAIGLIVIAGVFVIGIPAAALVAAIAVPAYQDYTVRAEVAQGLALTERTRALVGEYIGTRGALPDDNAALGLPRPGAIHARYVTSVAVSSGRVVVTYGNQANAWINGGHVVIAPSGNAARLHWRCSSPDIRVRYLPSSCR